VGSDGFTEQREDLLDAIERSEQDVRVALHELTDAAEHKLDIGERIKASPLVWAVGAFLVGAWLGARDGTASAADRNRSSQ
jgi:hypothetical protein